MLRKFPMNAKEACRRRSRRRNFSCSVRLHRPGEAHWADATTADFSREGFYCTSAAPFSPHERLECEFAMIHVEPGSRPEPDLVFRCYVEVVRLVANGVEPGYGVACRLPSNIGDLIIAGAAGSPLRASARA